MDNKNSHIGQSARLDGRTCCLNTRAIITYMKRRHGQLERLMQGLDKELKCIDAPIDFLSDPNNWVSPEVCRRLWINARAISGDELIAMKIGFDSIINKQFGYVQRILLRAFGSVYQAFPRIKQINAKFNRTKEIESVSLTRNKAVVRLHWYKDITFSVDFCLYNRGVYSAIPTIWGLPPARVDESSCQFTGGDYCEYHVSFSNPSLLHRVKSLFIRRSMLLSGALTEMERHKLLLSKRYDEVQELNLQLGQRIGQLVSIQKASEVILSEVGRSGLLSTVIGLFLEVIEYSRGIIMLADHETGMLKFAACAGGRSAELEKLKGYEIPLSQRRSLFVRASLDESPLVVEDARRLHADSGDVIINHLAPESMAILPLRAGEKLIGVLIADRRKSVKGSPAPDPRYLKSFANQVALAIETARMYRETRAGSIAAIQSLVQALEAKDPYTRGHSERVTLYAVRVAEAFELPGGVVERLRNMCLLHDIGKIGVSDRILNKIEKLSVSEFQVVQRHPAVGDTIIRPLNLSPDERAIVRNHHERYDGKGYPDSLAGEAIPISVRINTVCDSFDAMTSNRAYRGALSRPEAERRLEKAAGSQFDPRVVSVFVKVLRTGAYDDIIASAGALAN